MKTNIYVLYGGKSAEHDISLISALAIINALDKEKYNVYPVFITRDGVWCDTEVLTKNLENVGDLHREPSDSVTSSIGTFILNNFKVNEKNIVFPALHGPYGEDGTIQGLLEMLNIPYVGNGVLPSAIGIDKVVMKDLFAKEGIPQSKYTSLYYHNWESNKEACFTEIESTIGYPCFVKPAKLGSSVGINRAANRQELEEAIAIAFRYDRKLVIEDEVIGREMQISVVGNDYPESSVVGEFIQERSFMDYEAKYIDGKLVQVIPARLTESLSTAMRKTAVDCFKLLNCSGLVRVDYFVTEDDKYFVNEVNTMPGFTKLSMTPALWTKTDGTTYSQLVERLIDLGFERHEQKSSILNTR